MTLAARTDPTPAAPLDYVRGNARRAIAELQQLVRFPSVSTHPARRSDMDACAAWLAMKLRAIGLGDVQTISAGGPPMVYGHWLGRPDRPTLLIYGHYDVQPAGPEASWSHPPFAAQIEGDNLIGRGASDDKGQLFAHIVAIEAYQRTRGALPVNVRLLLEGEEEIGSGHLGPWLARNRGRLACDALVVSDTSMLGPGQPALTYGLRGHLAMEIAITREGAEAHSGIFAGAVPDPARALCTLLASLFDRRGEIAIAGFADRVRRRASDGALTAEEKVTLLPSITVTGLAGGYAGAGGKNAIPTRASARLDVRLVPDQDVAGAERALRRHLSAQPLPGMRLLMRRTAGAPPVSFDPRHPLLRTAAAAYRRGFGAAPAFVRSGGTIPIASSLRDLLGVPVALMGFGLPSDHIHGPNERMHIPGFFRGVATSVAFMDLLGAQGRAAKVGAAPS
jgi:acetylornithine deacetylase/succinyl-diaminopimelate desuccinylase-like protein